jgi:hypothetical protein
MFTLQVAVEVFYWAKDVEPSFGRRRAVFRDANDMATT